MKKAQNAIWAIIQHQKESNAGGEYQIRMVMNYKNHKYSRNQDKKGDREGQPVITLESSLLQQKKKIL